MPSKKVVVRLARYKRVVKITKQKPKPIKKKTVFKKPIKKNAKRKLVKEVEKTKTKEKQKKKELQKKTKKEDKPNKNKDNVNVKPQMSKEDKKGKVTYLSRLREAVESNKRYPRISQRFEETGTVVVQFRVFRSGRFADIVVLKSCGKKRLDKAALRAVQVTARFEPFPKHIKKSYMLIMVPIKFDIKIRK